MAKVKSKQVNHLISVLCIAVFGLSIVMLIVSGVMYLKSYQENQILEEKYQAMKDEYESIQDVYNDTDEEGYYNVYSDGELVIYEVGGTIIIE